MPQNLLIVESPSKGKTLKKYLGADFEILASYGHVRDLVPKTGAVDPEKNFAMKYQIVSKNSKHVDAIVNAVEQAQNIFLATDPDREGEAISWHLLQILEKKKLLKNKNVKRVVFHEITKKAVLDAVANPRELSLDLVNAQQARRALDYLVGFNLSPLLWKKIRRGLSAGRVQSPALRLICERAQEIENFQSQEYWSIHFDSHKGRQKFRANLIEWQGKKLEQFDLPSEAAQAPILKALEGKNASVSQVKKSKTTRKPTAPFITSTLQQESVRKLNMTSERTMRTAQQLYEGVDIGQGSVGLITYMRTDSVALANEAVEEIRQYIGEHFEPASLPKTPPVYKNNTKNAQEAHEAIRPTSIFRTPESLKPYLSAEQFKLYRLIWQRTLASQMTPAQFDTMRVDIALGEGLFRTSGQSLIFPGFMAVYQETSDDQDDDQDESKLPKLEEGETLPVDKLYSEQHFTQPPPPFTEASLIKNLEEFGIGRPSTYASIIKTLKDREYVTLDKKRFFPTDTGNIVNKFLTEHFKNYVDYQFTANLENQLDDISTGKQEWIPVLSLFWQDFHQQIESKASLTRAEVTTENLEEDCPKCGKPLLIKFGKRGRFVACSGYPDCDYTRNVGETAEQAAEPKQTLIDEPCPKCGSQLAIKTGRYGKFIGCTNYPNCRHMAPLEKPRDTGIECPVCHQGTLIERKSRFGKLFYSCSTYPTCNYAVWNPPINEACPQCGWPVMTVKTTKRRGTEKVCPQKACGHSIPAPELAPPPEDA